MKLLTQIVKEEIDQLAPPGADIGQLVLTAAALQVRLQQRVDQDPALRMLVKHFVKTMQTNMRVSPPNVSTTDLLAGTLALAIMTWEEANRKWNEQLQTKP